MGSAVRVQPSLQKVEVECKITDTATVIPRNSLIEANQSGLIAEPLIDIMPQLPIPAYEVCSSFHHKLATHVQSRGAWAEDCWCGQVSAGWLCHACRCSNGWRA